MHNGIRGISLMGAACMLALVSGCAQMPELGMADADAGRTNAAEPASPECNPVVGGAIGALALPELKDAASPTEPVE